MGRGVGKEVPNQGAAVLEEADGMHAYPGRTACAWTRIRFCEDQEQPILNGMAESGLYRDVVLKSALNRVLLYMIGRFFLIPLIVVIVAPMTRIRVHPTPTVVVRRAF
jgi:hypothetical protein